MSALFISNAGAEPSSISLAEVRALALERSPLVQATDSEYATRLAEAVQLTTLPNPELGVGVSVPVNWKESRGDNELEASIGQPLRLSHFGTRRAVSDLIEKMASAERQTELFKLLKEIDLGYLRLWVLQQQKRFLATAQSSAASRSREISQGLTRGIFSEGDQKIFFAEEARFQAGLLGVEGDIKAGEANLTRLVGRSMLSRSLVKPDMAAHFTVDAVRAKEKNSAIGASQRADLLVELANAQKRLARKDSFPEFTPQLMASRNDEGTTFLGAGITIPLPFSDRNQSQIIQRDGELRAAEARRNYVKEGAFSDEISALVDAVNLALSEAELFESKVVPAFQDSLRFQERQFREGSGSIFQIWQTQRELFESQAKALELWTKAFSLRIELEILVGQEL